MHAQVYKHHTRLVGDQMFLQALDLAVNEEDIIQKDMLCTDTDLGRSHEEFLDFYTSLDDYGLYYHILNKQNSNAASILERIRRRMLLKRVVDSFPDRDILNALVIIYLEWTNMK